MSWHRQQAGLYHPHTATKSCHDASGAPVNFHPLQAGDLVTVYHAETGAPMKCYPIDARELLAAGTHVLDPPE